MIYAMNVPLLFNRSLLKLHRDRSVLYHFEIQDIFQQCTDRLLERLDDINRSFEFALEIGGRGYVSSYLKNRKIKVISADLSAGLVSMNVNSKICMDEEFLPFKSGCFDLVIANFNLHWVNDLPGTLLQIRRILKPDGLFLATIPILPTLSLLRTVMAEVEMEYCGAVLPHISPLPDLRSCASLMQRAGFALPTIDKEAIEIVYRSSLALFRDLRWAGETNSLQMHQAYFAKKSLFAEFSARLETFKPIKVDINFAILTGWSPDASQPQPLKPGQFKMSLEEALRNK